MEENKGDEAFRAMGLKPQLLINDILNFIDDIVDAAFLFYHQESEKLCISRGDGRNSVCSDGFIKGISYLRSLVEEALNVRMNAWEQYCLNHCFSVPDGFIFSKNQGSSGNCLMHSEPSDEQLDLQIDSLRERLAAAGRKNAELQTEIYSLEKQARYDAAVMETIHLLEQNSVPQMIEEMKEAASKLKETMLEVMVEKKEKSGGLINKIMLKEGIWKQDEYLSMRIEKIQDVVRILKDCDH